MLLKDIHTEEIIEPVNKIDEYIKTRLKELKWQDKELVERSEQPKGEISKLKSGARGKLSARKFYAIYTAFGDSCDKARKLVYPDLDLTLNKYEDKDRNEFGKYMSSFEVIENSIEMIAAKTGIILARLKEIYYRTGAPEAYELLLIEKALNKKSGEMFKEFFGEAKE